MSTYVIIPTLNEFLNLKIVIPDILMKCENVRLIIIDDSQGNETREWLKDNYKEDVVSVLQQEGTKGFANAVVLGFKHAEKLSAKWIIQMDGDGTHPVNIIQEMLKTIQENNLDLIIGNRWGSQMKVKNFRIHRKTLSYCSKIYCRLILGNSIIDWTSGLKIMNLETAKMFIDLQTNYQLSGFAFQAVTTKKALTENKKILEIPITLANRINGKSKMRIKTIYEAIVMIYKFRR
jgi:dolichol-phosphate mannosyltransferase